MQLQHKHSNMFKSYYEHKASPTPHSTRSIDTDSLLLTSSTEVDYPEWEEVGAVFLGIDPCLRPSTGGLKLNYLF